MALYNDSTNNNLALSMINQAKLIDPSNINAYKAEIIANLRLEKMQETITLLQEYESKLLKMRESLDYTESDQSWDDTNNFTLKELDWIKKMQVKIKNM